MVLVIMFLTLIISFLDWLWGIKDCDSLSQDTLEVNLASGEEFLDGSCFTLADLLLIPLAHGGVLSGWDTGVAGHKRLVGDDEFLVLGAHLYLFIIK